MQDEEEVRQMSEAIALSLQQSGEGEVDGMEDDNDGEGVEAGAGPFGMSEILARSPRRTLAHPAAGASRERDEDVEGGASSWLFSPGSALNASRLSVTSAETNASPGARSGLLAELSAAYQHQRSVAQRVGPDDLDSIAGVVARRHHLADSSSEVRSARLYRAPPRPPTR